MNMKFATLAVLGTFALIVAAPRRAGRRQRLLSRRRHHANRFRHRRLGGDGELDDSSFKVIAGFRPLDWLAFEANYIDLGSDDDDGVELDTSADHGLCPGARGVRHRRLLCDVSASRIGMRTSTSTDFGRLLG